MPGEGFDVDTLVDLPRIASLHLSPDGARLVATVQTVAEGGKRYAGALWEIDPAGRRPARRLTHSAKGESAQGFLPDGSVLFFSDRPDLGTEEGKPQDAPALYVLPAAGGEPRRVLAPPGGIDAVAVARDAPVVGVIVPLHPGAPSFEEDEKREKARGDAGVQARLFDRVPIRYWDHHMGPREPHLMRLDLSSLDGDIPAPQDLTPSPPWAGWAEDPDVAVRPDGGMIAVAARVGWGRDYQAHVAVADAAGGFRVIRREDGDHAHLSWSPDGRMLAANLGLWGHPDTSGQEMLILVDPLTGECRRPAPSWESWVGEIAWAPDSSAMYVTSQERGRVALFRVGLDGEVTRLCRDGSFTHLCVAPDGTTLYALRSHVDAPPAVVALDTRTADQAPRHLWSPVEPPSAGCRTEEVVATSPDGTQVQAWLVLPDSASPENPAPLLTMIHGGPLMAFGAWSFRWNPLVFAARGWAVLMPNPRLSVGFGQEHVAASWNDWAEKPAADILAAVEAAAARPDVDETRMAASGGSYGGYMSNWIAGHSDGRFKAIVTHASLWAMDQFHGTTDYGPYMERHFGSPYTDLEAWLRQSPHRSIGAVRTPMLVIHGERDARVPVGEALRLFTDLQLHGVPSQFLWFPDENHWVLKPQNARVWYQTFLAFIEEHVLGQPPRRHELL